MSHAFNDLRRSDGGIWVCDPAILIGPTPGWEEQDVAAWGIDCGLLDEAGEIRNQRDQREALRAQGVQVRAARRKFTEPLASWRRVTRVYLNQVDLAAGLQIDHRNVIHRKRRGGLPEGAVTIETLDGWADDQMHQWSRQVNRPYSTPDYIARAVLENEGRLI
jgi:hypothetical protein